MKGDWQGAGPRSWGRGGNAVGGGQGWERDRRPQKHLVLETRSGKGSQPPQGPVAFTSLHSVTTQANPPAGASGDVALTALGDLPSDRIP